MRGLTPQRVVVLVVIAAAIASFLLFDLDRFLTVDWLKAQHAAVIAYRDARPLLAGVAFAGFYVVVTGLSLPGTIALALAGGAIFGLLWGTVLVSIAGSVGATVALLSARFLFRDAVEARFPQWFRRIDAGVARDGALYLLALRLVPIVPFFIVNLASGLTRMPVRTFYLVTQFGVLPATLIFVNAGTELARIQSLQDVLSVPLVAALAFMGALPLLGKYLLDINRARRLRPSPPR